MSMLNSCLLGNPVGTTPDWAEAPAGQRFIIVEDNDNDAELVIRRLSREGFKGDWIRVDHREDYLDALNQGCDLILSDWALPGFSGLEALALMRERNLDIPFIIFSASISGEEATQAIHMGAADYLMKDRPERLGQAVRNALENKRLRDQQKKTEAELRAASQELREAYDATLQGWSNALELREHETSGHSKRVVQNTLSIARLMGIEEAQIIHIQRGALLHDIGKIGIPDDILLKPGPLTSAEWRIMKLHPIYAYNLLFPIPYLKPALQIPYYHHERWDGSGYPEGLERHDIPLAARIFAVVDVWDALSHDRPYRPAWSKDMVEQYLRDQAGVTLDPEVVSIFLGGTTSPIPFYLGS